MAGKSSRSKKSASANTNTTTKSGKRSAVKKKKRTAKTADAAIGMDGAESMDLASDSAARAALLESDKLYYRIGEVSRLTGVKAHVLRYWETEFRWMAPPKSRSKQRLYRKRDIEFVWLLKRLLWDERYTIAGARQRIQDLGVEDALALLDQPSGASREASSASGVETPDAKAEWARFRVALDEMRSDLTALRGVLQEPA